MSHRRGRRVVSCVALLGTVTALSLTGLPRAVAQPLSPLVPGENGPAATRKGDYDSRTVSGIEPLNPRVLPARRRAARAELTRRLGDQGVQRLDPVTGTPALLTRFDGFLTEPSRTAAQTVALRYVRAHQAAFGLSSADVDTFRLRKRYVDVAGIQHLSWIQVVDGIPLFGNGLKANVSAQGQLISVLGAPVPGLTAAAARAGERPVVTAGQARDKAARDVGGATADSSTTVSSTERLVTWRNDDRAQLVWFASAEGVRLAWSTYVQAGDSRDYQHVVDATTGQVLYRHDTIDSERGPLTDPAAGGTTPSGSTTRSGPTTPSNSAAPSSSAAPADNLAAQASTKGRALVVDNYPGAPRGGKQRVAELVRAHLVSASASTLDGPYVNAYADLNDDDVANAGETVPVPGTASGTAQYKLTSFNTVSPLCSSKGLCTWDPDQPNSWRTNLRADVTQGFFFNSVYHNYLLHKPFGFTRAAGNFEARDGDAVQLNALDGADTASGLPDGNHVDNANMSTPPDGTPPRMQMYLFHEPGASPSQDSLVPTSSSFSADIILHEYTHGLSNRLVVDAGGNSTLNSIQAGSMGEAWSDYYALDYLVHRHLEVDTTTVGQVLEGKYVTRGGSIRTMGIDCPTHSTSTRCRSASGHRGGYTYGDFSKVIGGAEVHASGEVWAQTLWDLRRRLGHTTTGMLVTRAMELSPADPSFLDMRNAIVQADRVVYKGRHTKTIWSVFAHRGMGYFAASNGGGDATPAQSFARPPTTKTPRVSVKGLVKDAVTKRPLVNAVVSISGHDSGFPGDLKARTSSTGRYVLTKVPVGRYPLVTVAARGGYALSQKGVVVKRGGTRSDFRPRRDWAAEAGGGAVSTYTGPNLAVYGCGPDRAIDVDQGTGWLTSTGNNAFDPTGTAVPKQLVVHLPVPITLTSFAVDPSAPCGLPADVSTARYTIETSADGLTWTQVKSGTFGSNAVGRFNAVTVAAPVTRVSDVRFTILSPQVPSFAQNCPDGPYYGCQYMGLTELEVFGKK